MSYSREVVACRVLLSLTGSRPEACSRARRSWKRAHQCFAWSVVVGALLGLPNKASAEQGPVRSQPAIERPQRQAADHFDRGYASAQRGDYAAAAIEFARAYELDPKPAVLFNLGQAYAASGQPLAAYDALEQYLRLSQGELEPQRERRARELIDIAASRIGQLWIEVEPDGAQIEADGRHIGVSPLQRSVRMVSGPHALVVRAPGYTTRAISVNVRPRVDSQIFVGLEATRREASGVLLLGCSVPDMEVSIDGQPRGTIPGRGFIPLAAGRHLIVVRRAGYVPESALVELQAGASHSYSCEGKIEPRLAPSSAGTLSLLLGPSPDDARVYVDGRAVPHGSLTLPSGRHVVDVRSASYEPWSQEIVLAPGATEQIKVELVSTDQVRKAALVRRRDRQLWSKVTLGSGIALAATAVTLSVINAEKHATWLEERNALNREDLTSEGVASRFRSNAADVLEIERLKLATIGAGVLGAGALVLSAYLWLTVENVSGGEHVSAHVEPQGARVLFRGSF